MLRVASSRYCHLCGRRLVGRYVRFETGLTVCGACEATRPPCGACGVPLSDAEIAANAGGAPPRLCARCHSAVPQCVACQRPIVGVFYTFEELLPTEQVRRFCAACVRSRPHCDLCRAPVAEGMKPFADGQWRCALCASDAIVGIGPTRAVYTDANAAFARVTRSPLRAAPRLEVVSRRAMGTVRRRYEHGAAPTDDTAGHHVLGFFVRAGESATIYVETALPRVLLLGTLAHELGHAWQAERAPTLRDPLLCEGFAEWVAHRVLVADGRQTAAARATRRDDLYGRGLRHFLNLERRHGASAVLAAIEHAR